MSQLSTLFTPEQNDLLARLAAGDSLWTAAQALGLAPATVQHWRRMQPAFALALHDTQSSHADHHRATVAALAPLAFEALEQLVTNPNTPPTVRLKAALHILNTATTPVPQDKQEPHLRELAREQDLIGIMRQTLRSTTMPATPIQQNSSLSTTPTQPVEAA